MDIKEEMALAPTTPELRLYCTKGITSETHRMFGREAGGTCLPSTSR